MTSPSPIRLGVNIDHVATLRNARGGLHPAPVRAAQMAQTAGADGITIHLREDRRHILDNDVHAIKEAISIPLNFEMAATQEMQSIALEVKPHAVCLVPERRQERTTEGGLSVANDEARLKSFIAPLREAGFKISLFVAPDPRELEAACRVGAHIVELHTGAYCDYHASRAFDARDHELTRLEAGARVASDLGLEVHAGHGLSYDDVGPIAAIAQVVELNIGHFLISEAIFGGLGEAIQIMRRAIDAARHP